MSGMVYEKGTWSVCATTAMSSAWIQETREERNSDRRKGGIDNGKDKRYSRLYGHAMPGVRNAECDTERVSRRSSVCGLFRRPLMPMGYAILQERPTNRITVQVDVERDQLDRLIDDVVAVNDTVDGIIQKIGKIKEG